MARPGAGGGQIGDHRGDVTDQDAAVEARRDDVVGAPALQPSPAAAWRGCWRACAAVMPGRRRARCACSIGLRPDHGHRVDAPARRRSRAGAGRRARRAARRPGRQRRRKRPRPARTSGWTIASSRRSAVGSPKHGRPSTAAVDAAGRAQAAGEGRRDAAPPPRRRGRSGRGPRRRRRTPARRRPGSAAAARLLPMAIEPVRPSRITSSSTPWSRRNCSSGSSGRPWTVKWSPSTRAMSWAPRPSSW